MSYRTPSFQIPGLVVSSLLLSFLVPFAASAEEAAAAKVDRLSVAILRDRKCPIS